MIGKLVGGRYKLVSLRGSGGMGEVYEAQDTAEGRRVAVKLLLGDGAGSQQAVSRFFREARATMGLGSPNVVRVFDMARDPESGAPFMVMEYLDGEDLGQLLSRVGALPAEIALRIGAQAAAGLGSAHAAGVIHRDVKPANLFLARTEDQGVVVKVLDFGIAMMEPALGSEATALTRSGSLIGSPVYMSPEQARGSRRVDPRSDLWSLGVVVYRAIAGRAPLQDITALGELILALCAAPPKPLRALAPWASEQVESLLLRALQIDPAARFPSAAAMREALLALLPQGDSLTASGLAGLEDARAALGLPKSDVATTMWLTEPAGDPAAPTGEVSFPPSHGFPPTGPASAHGAPVPSRQFRGRRAVAVLGFKNLTGRPESAWLSAAFGEMLSAELAIGEQLRVIPGEQAPHAASAGTFGDDTLRRDALGDLGRALGADFIVSGSYLAIPAGADLRIRVAASLHEVASGEVLATAAETDTEVEIIALVARVGARLRASLGVDEGPAPSAPGAAFPEERGALRFYAEGVERLRRLDLLEARDLLERAVAAAPEHPLPRAGLAEALLALGHERRAHETAREAMALSGSLRREDRMFVEGRLHEVCKDFERAALSYQALFTFFPDNIEYGLRLAEAQTQGGQGKEALETLAALRRLPRPASDDPRIELAEAAAADALSDYSRELDAAGRAAARAHASGARLLLGRARIAQANALVRLGKRDDAAAACEDARRIFGEVGDRAGEARAWNRIANIAYEEGRFADAERMFGEARAIWRELGHGSGLSQALNNIADSRVMQGRIAEARPLFEQAAAAARDSGDAQKLGLVLANLADLCGRLGELAAARDFAAEALRTVRPIGYVYGLHAALSALATAALDAGDLDQSQSVFEESLALARRVADVRLVAWSLHGAGGVRFERGEHEDARELFEEARALRAAGGFDADAAESRVALARLALAEHRAEDASALLASAAEAFRATGMLQNLALVDAMTLRLAAAEGSDAQALAADLEARAEGIEHASIRLSSWIGAGEARAAAGEWDRARGLLSRARDEADRLGFVPLACEARVALAALEEKAGRPAIAAELRAEVEERASPLHIGRFLRGQ